MIPQADAPDRKSICPDQNERTGGGGGSSCVQNYTVWNEK